VIWPRELEIAFEDLLDKHLSSEEYLEVLRSDAIIRGILRNPTELVEMYCVVGFSRSIEPSNIMATCHRAGLLRKAGLDSLPVVAGEVLTEEARKVIQKNPKLVITDVYKYEEWNEFNRA
jgi:phenylacetate-coenzyme A ligase PaaK-like adenylate-forming protein